MPKLDHIALEVSDMDRAIAFYTTNLGFSFVSKAVNREQQESFCYLESEGTRLELICDLRKKAGGRKKPQRPFCPHVCFQTDNLTAAVDDLAAQGIEILHGPLEIRGEAAWVYFSDPDGNVLEYIEWYR